MTTPIEKLLDSVAWEPLPSPETPSDMPYLAHKGVLELPGITLQCGVLNDGRRIFFGDEIEAMVDGLKEIVSG